MACVSFENHRRLIEQESRQDEARCFSGNADGATTVRQLLEDSSRPLADAGPELIERLGVGRLLDRGIRTLSNGEIRRVLIARVLLAAPEVLVLDEPFDGLDLPARENLAAMVGALMNGAGTVVLVTHRLSQIPAQVTHVMGIRAGRVLFQGLRTETSRRRTSRGFMRDTRWNRPRHLCRSLARSPVRAPGRVPERDRVLRRQAGFEKSELVDAGR